jgi:tetratricopeptide (TPR) repeat protein
VAFLEGHLNDVVLDAFETHLAGCDRCRELASACRGGDGTRSFDTASSAAIPRLEDAATGSDTAVDPAPPGCAEPLVAGTVIGRYLVIEQIGAGGMGVVYAAIDLELDRKIAIKILRTDEANAHRRAVLEDRLIKEARAMAQLAHPTVVAVFEIGGFRDQMFLAMELVEGHTLARWLTAQPRSWREIVEAFAAAGQGLAAAHAAGLVHRDFKPANVLVGRDGRVRVTDFGLAQYGTSGSPRGGVAGTPSYMAPEQFRGEPTDARTDQFNFCVALYRALYDQPPFAGSQLDELAAAVSTGRPAPPPAISRVPRWLGRIVVRGLAADPEDRYRSMDELLRALRRDPHRWLRSTALFAAIAGTAVAASLVFSQGDARPTCADAASRIAVAWSPQDRRVIERAFLDSKTAFAPHAFAEVAQVFDAYQKRWTDMRIDACEAARTGPGSADELVGLRTLCLDRRLGELRALIGAFATASPDVVQRAPQVVHELTDLQVCADARALLGPARLPTDPAERAQIDRLTDAVGQARALYQVGHYEDALARARPLVDQVRATRYRPLEAETQLLVGDAAYDSGKFADSESSFNAALFAAEAGRSDEVAIKALFGLMYIKGTVQAHFEQATRDIAPRVTAILERLGGNDELEARLHTTLTMMSIGTSQFMRAVDESKRALALLEKRFGPSDPRVMPGLYVRIWSALFADDARTALELSERMLAIRTRVSGSDNPEVAQAYLFLGMALAHTPRYPEARAAFERAVAIRERTQGADNPMLVEPLARFSEYDRNGGRFREALSFQRRVLAIIEKTSGVKSWHYAQGQLSMAKILNGMRRDADALAMLRKAQPGLVETEGEDSLTRSAQLEIMGEVLLRAGRYAEARERVQSSLATLERILGPGHAWGASRHHLFGEIDLALGRPQQALASLERARSMSNAEDGSIALELAEIDFCTARALAALHREPSRADMLARAARAMFAAVPDLTDRVREVDAWLARHVPSRAADR